MIIKQFDISCQNHINILFLNDRNSTLQNDEALSDHHTYFCSVLGLANNICYLCHTMFFFLETATNLYSIYLLLNMRIKQCLLYIFSPSVFSNVQICHRSVSDTKSRLVITFFVITKLPTQCTIEVGRLSFFLRDFPDIAHR